MARNRRYKRRRIRGRYRRRRRYRHRRRRRPYMAKIAYLKLKRTSGFPDQLYVKMRFRQLINYSDSPIHSQIYSINSIYDPDVTGGPAQPNTYDQWSQFYSRYQVMGSSIRVRVISVNNADRYGIVVYPSNTSTPAITPTNAIEQRYAKSFLIGSATQGAQFRLKHYCSVRKLEARQTDSVNFTGGMGSGAVGSSPTIQKYWHIIVYALDDTTLLDIFLEAKLMYYVKLFEPLQIAQS